MNSFGSLFTEHVAREFEISYLGGKLRERAGREINMDHSPVFSLSRYVRERAFFSRCMVCINAFTRGRNFNTSFAVYIHQIFTGKKKKPLILSS